MNFLAYFEKLSKPFVVALGFILIGIVGIIDYLTGYELSFSLFYLIPITLVTWYAGQRFGLAMSLVSALVWSIIDVASGAKYSHPLIYVWNTLIILVFFVIVTLLLSLSKKILEHEHKKYQLIQNRTSGSKGVDIRLSQLTDIEPAFNLVLSGSFDGIFNDLYRDITQSCGRSKIEGVS